MTKSLKQLRRDAKALRKAHQEGELRAEQRVATYRPRPVGTALKYADYLHVIARENSFPSWPALKLAADMFGMDMAAKRQRLKMALCHGQFTVADRLLEDTPDLAQGDFGLCLGLYLKSDVIEALNDAPDRATQLIGNQAPPLTVLARSKWIHHKPDLTEDMLHIARALLEHGADINLGALIYDGNDYRLSPLYFAIGHANNMSLGRWMLENGADPNDGESLYHATELGHHDGLEMLLSHGADPKGTNALLRAMDFHDTAAVQMLLEHGARVDEFDGTHVGGEAPWVVPALHQAARRMSKMDMVDLLLDNGADPNRRYEGTTPYAYARVFGHHALAQRLAEAGADTTLSDMEALLASAAEGASSGLIAVPEKIPEAYRNIIRMILHIPGKLEHVQRLVSIGVEYDRPDTEGLTPVQVAGWEGLPEVMAYFLSLKPDLTHMNSYGGTLLSTILHGSENCPQRHERNYVDCLHLALEEGVPLPRRAIELAGEDDIAEFLSDWAEQHPDQVVESGVG
ncbi:ankyrin repeat domain-containing protein [uncultured Tateyamaria sp.]|uniref:ankyrin repeat domain-containing protein n=1 Tax=uncultured Tateyamaria sp. TaxID=455651 RepID=UPI0026349179|nr:ankyrin repeat domain-containing protein [uncultured Tateyamaria sp.]